MFPVNLNLNGGVNPYTHTPCFNSFEFFEHTPPVLRRHGPPTAGIARHSWDRDAVQVPQDRASIKRVDTNRRSGD
jgi:hypothetical protein